MRSLLPLWSSYSPVSTTLSHLDRQMCKAHYVVQVAACGLEFGDLSPYSRCSRPNLVDLFENTLVITNCASLLVITALPCPWHRTGHEIVISAARPMASGTGDTCMYCIIPRAARNRLV